LPLPIQLYGTASRPHLHANGTSKKLAPGLREGVLVIQKKCMNKKVLQRRMRNVRLVNYTLEAEQGKSGGQRPTS